MAQGLVGVGGVPRNISEIKVGAGGVRTVTEAYMGVNGAPRLCWSGNKWANKPFYAHATSTVNGGEVFSIDANTLVFGAKLFNMSANCRSTGGDIKSLTTNTTETGGATWIKIGYDMATGARFANYGDSIIEWSNSDATADRATGYYWALQSAGNLGRFAVGSMAFVDKSYLSGAASPRVVTNNGSNSYANVSNRNWSKDLVRVDAYVAGGFCVEAIIVPNVGLSSVAATTTSIYTIEQAEPYRISKLDINSGASLATVYPPKGGQRASVFVCKQ